MVSATDLPTVAYSSFDWSRDGEQKIGSVQLWMLLVEASGQAKGISDSDKDAIGQAMANYMKPKLASMLDNPSFDFQLFLFSGGSDCLDMRWGNGGTIFAGSSGFAIAEGGLAIKWGAMCAVVWF